MRTNELWTCERCHGHDRPKGVREPRFCKACRRPTRYVKTCVLCNQTFMARAKNAKYCEACKTYTIVCVGCGTSFETKNQSAKMCTNCAEKEKELRKAAQARWNENRKHAATSSSSKRTEPLVFSESDSIQLPSSKQKKMIELIEQQLGVHFDGVSSKSAWLFINTYVNELSSYEGHVTKSIKNDRTQYEQRLQEFVYQQNGSRSMKMRYTEFSDDKLRAFSVFVSSSKIIGVASEHDYEKDTFDFRVVYEKSGVKYPKSTLYYLVDFLRNLISNDVVKL